MYWVLAKQLSCYSRKHQNSSSTLASSMPPNNPDIGLNPVDYWILTIPWYRAATWWHLDKNPAQRRRRSRWLVAARMREGKMSSFWSRTCARIIISLIWLCVRSSCVRSSMLHGSETWPVRKENVVALQRAEMRMVISYVPISGI